MREYFIERIETKEKAARLRPYGLRRASERANILRVKMFPKCVFFRFVFPLEELFCLFLIVADEFMPQYCLSPQFFRNGVGIEEETADEFIAARAFSSFLALQKGHPR